MPISNFYNNNYLLLEIQNFYVNRKITIQDVYNVSKLNLLISTEKKNYYLIWKYKIDFMENYFNSSNNDKYLDYDYFLGMSELALTLVKMIDFSKITYGFSYKRFYNINSLYELFNPCNVLYGPIINSFSEFIKYSFFYNNRYENIDVLFKLDLTNSDILFFIARLIFPTYFFDLFKNENIDDYYKIINKIDLYFYYVKNIILQIKKRYNTIPFLDNLVNQL